jgi:tRNA(Ile)-lysidine synthase
VAYSAGRDSTALLHATVRAALYTDVEVLALHVHHGLSAQADAWLHHAESRCARWAAKGWPVRFMATRLKGRPARGDSVEAWAREARYRALADMAREGGASMVLLAHHLRDQAETWLLQALRGAGAAGLASMPASVAREGLTWVRPWLGKPREDIEAYVRRHRLTHVDDDSNGDPRFLRNRLRIEVWPALTRAFPEAEASLGQAAAWAQQAVDCLDEIAAEDLARATSPEGALKVPAWLGLSPARRGNALRAWLRPWVGGQGGTVPASLVVRLQQELGAGEGVARWHAPGGMLRRHRGQLSFVADAAPAAQQGRPAAPETTLGIRRAGRHALPGWRGTLEARRVKEGGIPLAWMAHLELRPRQGGERFQAGFERPARSLKKQYQSAGVPAWEREGPLVYSGGQLLFVPGLGIDARVIGLPGQAQMSLRWIGAPDPGGLPEDGPATR